jgi:beta-glucosidase
VRWQRIPFSVLDQPSHRALARQVARESIVLLKNQGGLLPLRKGLGTIAVIGPNANEPQMMLGNYNGTPKDPITPLRGIREAVGGGTRVLYARGSDLAPGSPPLGAGAPTTSDALEAEAVQAAQQADVVVLVLGLTARLEGEEMPIEVPGFKGGDRTSIDLPAPQQRLLERVVAVGKPTVLVLLNGSALAVSWGQEHVPAVLEAWYPGQAGGSAIADVLFGDYNPAGRLPVTFYRDTRDLPAFDDYRMANRTYRYFKGTPLYPFGHGLSYTTFAYAKLRTSGAPGRASDTIMVRVNVTNTGRRAGDEVVQLYVQHVGSVVDRPLQELKAYKRVTLQPGQTRTVALPLAVRSLAYWNAERHAWVVESDSVRLQVGSSSGDVRVSGMVRALR